MVELPAVEGEPKPGLVPPPPPPPFGCLPFQKSLSPVLTSACVERPLSTVKPGGGARAAWAAVKFAAPECWRPLASRWARPPPGDVQAEEECDVDEKHGEEG